MTVVVDNEHSREPDAAVQYGVSTDLDATILEAHLIVVEITSPSSQRDDAGDKLVDYFWVQHPALSDRQAGQQDRDPSRTPRPRYRQGIAGDGAFENLTAGHHGSGCRVAA
jgi:hypothetical protein